MKTTDENNLTTVLEYDANNNRLSLTDPKSATRSWTYDERNLTVSKSMPDANDTCLYSYDALARLEVKTPQDASTITMVYDLAGRMVERAYSDSTSDTFTYDGASRLLTATKGRHAITTTRSYFADGKVMEWFHDSRHLVTSAKYDGTQVLTQQYDAGYRLTQQAFANNLTRNITYGRLDNLRTADKTKDGITTIAELDFTYDYLADKNVHKETQTAGTFEDLSFTATYDSGNRVSSYARADSYPGARETQSWDYDGAGNWDSTVIDGNTQNRTHSASDQLEVIAGDNLTYDSKGNLLTDERGNEYTWDTDNRIVKSEGSGYTDIEYRYDALGRRIVRKQGTEKEVLLWWGNTEQSEHKHQAGQTTIQNDLQANPSERALNTIFARALEGSKFEIQYLHKNYLDHVMAVSADNGNLLEHYRYTAFGEPEVCAPNGTRLAATAIENDILWNSRRYEFANGLYMYLYRDYDAPNGRWPSRDPIGERGGINLYSFVGNDGVGKIDKHGLSKFKCCLKSLRIIHLGVVNSNSVAAHQFGMLAKFEEFGKLKTDDSGMKVCCDPERCKVKQELFGQQYLGGIGYLPNSATGTAYHKPGDPISWEDDGYSNIPLNPSTKEGSDVDTSPLVYSASDGPGVYGPAANKVIAMSFKFRFTVSDVDGDILGLRNYDVFINGSPSHREFTWVNFDNGSGSATYENGVQTNSNVILSGVGGGTTENGAFENYPQQN